jgi:hypothetical protein
VDGQQQNVVTQSLSFFGQPMAWPNHNVIIVLNPWLPHDEFRKED